MRYSIHKDENIDLGLLNALIIEEKTENILCQL